MREPKNCARNARICALRRQGVEPTDIAARLDLSRNTVLGVLYRSGMTDNRSEKAKAAAYTSSYRAGALAARKKLGLCEAARQWCVSTSTLSAWARGL